MLNKYRPISNFKILGKTIVRVVSARISNYMQTHRLTDIFQSCQQRVLIFFCRSFNITALSYCVVLRVPAPFASVSEFIIPERVLKVGIDGAMMVNMVSVVLQHLRYIVKIGRICKRPLTGLMQTPVVD